MSDTSRDRIQDFVTYLQRADIFYDLSMEELAQVAVLCEDVTLKNGEAVFEESSSGNELYLIVSGEIAIQVSPSLVQASDQEDSGELRTIATLRRGQTFGEVALVDQGLRSAGARCAAPEVRLLRIPRDGLLALCNSQPRLGYRIMRSIAADLAFKIRNTDMMLREQLLWASP